MRTYFVVQNVASFRIDWSCLHQPDRYRLVLITSALHRPRLEKSNQLRYFDRVVVPPSFTAGDLIVTIHALMREMHIGPRDTRIACHDEYSLGAAAGAREALGIPGAKPVEIRRFVDKLAMKAAVAAQGIRVPRQRPSSIREA